MELASGGFAMHRINRQEAYSLDGDIYTNNAESFFWAHARKTGFYFGKIVASALKIIT